MFLVTAGGAGKLLAGTHKDCYYHNVAKTEYLDELFSASYTRATTV